VKFTGDDLGDLGRVIDLCGDTRRLFFGRDDMLLPAMALGVRAAVGMTFNYTTPVARALVTAFDAHDLPEARRQQKTIRDLLGASAPYGLINGLKGVAAIVGVAVGPCRAPLLTLAKSEALDIAENLGLERALRPIAETAKRAA
jgi:N-acetylneuraminate lyase